VQLNHQSDEYKASVQNCRMCFMTDPAHGLDAAPADRDPMIVESLDAACVLSIFVDMEWLRKTGHVSPMVSPILQFSSPA
jgi:hypothetical protein